MFYFDSWQKVSPVNTLEYHLKLNTILSFISFMFTPPDTGAQLCRTKAINIRAPATEHIILMTPSKQNGKL